MKIYRFKTSQKIPLSLKEAWDFLSDPKNLKTITPDYMGFKILEGGGEKMYAGQIIKYTVTPILGFPVQWVTEITHMKNFEYFVDEQRYGPYSMWHHQHFLKKIKVGVEMTDIINYKLPFGFLGTIAQPIIVKRKLKAIFDYRSNKLIQLFGEYKV